MWEVFYALTKNTWIQKKTAELILRGKKKSRICRYKEFCIFFSPQNPTSKKKINISNDWNEYIKYVKVT